MVPFAAASQQTHVTCCHRSDLPKPKCSSHMPTGVHAHQKTRQKEQLMHALLRFSVKVTLQSWVNQEQGTALSPSQRMGRGRHRGGTNISTHRSATRHRRMIARWTWQRVDESVDPPTVLRRSVPSTGNTKHPRKFDKALPRNSGRTRSGYQSWVESTPSVSDSIIQKNRNTC